MRILVVDPNEAFATLLSEELKREGHDVVLCLTGDDAFEAAQERSAGLAILDMALSQPDAPLIAQRLREMNASTRLMLIPLMGEALVSQNFVVPYQGVLPKPFFLPELPGLIESALNAPLDPSQSDAVESTSELSVFVLPVDEVDPPEEVQDYTPGLSRAAFAAHRIEVERLMNDLVQDVGADAVLLTFEGGLLAWVGGLEQTAAESIARAIIHGWQTSAEVARILGREQVRFEQSIAGDDYMLYALSVESNAIMGVAVRGAAPLGLLRHRSRTVAEKIAQLCAP